MGGSELAVFKKVIKIFILISLCIIAFISSCALQNYHKFPLGSSCIVNKDQTSFAPNHLTSIHMESYICGFFKRNVLHIGIHYKGKETDWAISNFVNWSEKPLLQLSYMNDVSYNSWWMDNNIDWSGKPLLRKPYDLPKLIWKNNQEVDLYIKDPVRYGDKTIKIDKDLTGRQIEPFFVRIHYELAE